jgi:hypothetical protein
MALIKGKEVKESPKDYPANERLWNMITTQARTRFSTYPSPAAAHWVRTRYAQMGGKFVQSKKEIDPRFKDVAEEKKQAKEKQAKKQVRRDVTKDVTKKVTK